ncbi:protein Spindly-like [Clavelina lepadiformis]|uniref:Uncharacterized protein n=1 Tax=Clavelina lepadiformis TaxID=159417 RepID=A0ABP0FKJ7_CLALP
MVFESKEEITKLTKALQEKEKSLETAAQYGKSLLEAKSHLEDLLEETHADYEKQLEALEQGKYSLEMKLELQQKSASRLESALAEEKHIMKRDYEVQLELLEKDYKTEINELKLKLSEMRNELDETALQCNQQKEKIETQQALIIELKESNQFQAKNESMSPDLAELVSDNERLQMKVRTLQEESSTMSNYIEQLNLQMKGIDKTNEMLREGKEEAEEQNRCHMEALEECRQEIRDLNAELQEFRTQPQDTNRFGNSLFAEVEDKRVLAEKKLISFQVKYRCLEGKYTQQVNYSMQLNSQIAQLLLSCGSDADRDQIQRLERALSTCRRDVENLMEENAKLEKQIASKSLNTLDGLKKASENGQQDVDFISFLENLLEKSKRENEKLKDELQKSRMYLIAESQKLSHAERDVYSSKNELDKLKSVCVKQKLDITRLKMKCGEEVHGKRDIRPRKVEKITDDPSQHSDDKENKSSPSKIAPSTQDKQKSADVRTIRESTSKTNQQSTRVGKTLFSDCSAIPVKTNAPDDDAVSECTQQ